MYEIRPSRSFRKSLKRYRHQKKLLTKIEAVLFLLQKNGSLSGYGEHTLSGRLAGFQECHIEPDLLLVYRVFPKEQHIVLQDIGSHSHIFG